MDNRRLWISAAGVALLHLALTAPMSVPFNLPDEAAYLANARQLAAPFGDAPPADLRGNYFYQAGYSLLIAPAFLITDDPRWIYRIALGVNGLLAALAFVVAARLAHEALGAPEPLAVALVASLHASALLTGSVAGPGAAMGLFLLLSFRATVRWLGGGAARWGWLAAAAAVFLGWLHPRGVLVAPAWLAGAGLLALRRPPLRRTWVSLAAGVPAGLALGWALHRYLMGLSWGGEDAAHAPGESLALLSTLSGAGRVLLVGVGQLWYLVAASFGVAVLGAVAMAQRAAAALRDGDPVGEALLVFAAPLALVTAASCLVIARFLAEGVRYGDYLLYGRYNAAYLGLFLLFGLHRLRTGERRALARASLAAALIVAAGAGVLLVGWPAQVWQYPVAKLNALGLGPAVHELRWTAPFLAVAAGAALLTLALPRLAGSTPRAPWAAGALFAAAAAIDHGEMRWYQRQGQRELTAALALAERPPAQVALLECSDDACRKWFAAAQFLLPDTRWTLFGDGDAVPALPVVIAPPRFASSLHGYRILARERSLDRVVWARAEGSAP